MRSWRARAVVVLAMGIGLSAEPAFSPLVPRTWDAEALAGLEVPHPNEAFSPKAVPVDYYYRIPVRKIYRGYPVYAPGREPAGYFEIRSGVNPKWCGTTAPFSRGSRRRPTGGELARSSFDGAIFYNAVARLSLSDLDKRALIAFLKTL
jgi:hypothetical protein